MSTRVLITGIGGSIGIHMFCHLMHKTDWEVVGVDSFRHKGLYNRITEALHDHPSWIDRLQLVTHDLRAPFSEMTQAKMGQIDHIINFASLPDVADSIADPVPFIMSNTAIMLNVLEFARTQLPLSTFVHISTDEVYGQTDGIHLHGEWAPSIPSSPYSASKVSQEAAAIAYWRTYRLPLVIVNLMNNFGEMQSPAKFPSIVIKKVMRGETVTIHGSETAVGTRHYIHSRNASDAILFLMRQTPRLHVEGDVDRPDRYNVRGGPAITNLDMARMIAEIIGKPLFYKYEPFNKTRPGHDWHYGLDGTKLHDIGWAPPVSFEKSLRDTVEWYLSHPDWLDPR